MTPLDLLRVVGPALLALAAAFFVDRLCAATGLLPPGFPVPWRRGAALALLARVLWIGVFAPLGMLGLEPELDLSGLTVPRLFLLHGILVATLVGWFLLGYAGSGPRRPRPPLRRAVRPRGAAPAAGDRARAGPRPRRSGSLVLMRADRRWRLGRPRLGGEDALPKQPPALIPWIAGLPSGVRLLISLSAGVVEETFFRGFLQPRIGHPALHRASSSSPTSPTASRSCWSASRSCR